MKKIGLLLFVLPFCSNIYSQDPCLTIPTVEYAGKTYNTVAIGDQCWLKENLNVGVIIDSMSAQSNNGIIEKYCYKNDNANCTTYGGLYQWAEVVQYQNGATDTTPTNPALTGMVQGICPTGWHIPTNYEFGAFPTSYGNALKAVGQGTGGGVGTDSSGFSALLAGYRSYYVINNLIFYQLGDYSWFWSSSESSGWFSVSFYLSSSDSYIQANIANKRAGMSVRCVYDKPVSALPVELDLFTAVVNGRTIQLRWETQTESNSYQFVVERKTNNTIWESFGSIKAAGMSNSPKQYSFTDKNLQSGKYLFRLKMIDKDGIFEYSNVVETEVALPKNFDLSQNFPNPFNPSTVIKYSVPFESNVNIRFYNSLGQCVREVNEGNRQSGNYEINFSSSGLASGIYFYSIKAVSADGKNDFSAIKKMILLK